MSESKTTQCRRSQLTYRVRQQKTTRYKKPIFLRLHKILTKLTDFTANVVTIFGLVYKCQQFKLLLS